MAKKYKMGALASEEHRYPDAAACQAAARRFYQYCGDEPGGTAPPPHIEVPSKPPPDVANIYSWRLPGTDVEMRFIVVTALKSPEIVRYYRVEGGEGKDVEANLREAMTAGELGVGYITHDTSPVNGQLVWRAIVRKKTRTGETMGYTPNPPYPP